MSGTVSPFLVVEADSRICSPESTKETVLTQGPFTTFKPGGLLSPTKQGLQHFREIKPLKMDEVISDFAPRVGFKVCEILSSDLASHSRIFNPAFTQRGKKEHLILLRKSNDQYITKSRNWLMPRISRFTPLG